MYISYLPAGRSVYRKTVSEVLNVLTETEVSTFKTKGRVFLSSRIIEQTPWIERMRTGYRDRGQEIGKKTPAPIANRNRLLARKK